MTGSSTIVGNQNSSGNSKERPNVELTGNDASDIFQTSPRGIEEKNESAVSIMRRMRSSHNEDKHISGSSENSNTGEISPPEGTVKDKEYSVESEHQEESTVKDIKNDLELSSSLQNKGLIQTANRSFDTEERVNGHSSKNGMLIMITRDQNLYNDTEQQPRENDIKDFRIASNPEHHSDDASYGFDTPNESEEASEIGAAESNDDQKSDVSSDESLDGEEYRELCSRKEELMRLKSELLQKLNKTKTPDSSPKFELVTYLQHCQILQHYSHLPSLDIHKRLKLVKMFYPRMIIRDVILRKALSLDTILEFTFSFSQIIKFKIHLVFDCTLLVQLLKITLDENIFVNSECREVRALASFCQDRVDISFFMHAINSFVDLFRERTALWVDLFVAYFDRSIRINSMTSKDHKNDDLRLLGYSLLKSSRTFDFVLPKQELIITYGFYFSLCPNVSDDCKSSLTCVLYSEDNNSDKILDLTSTLNGLVKVEGPYNGCCRLLDSLK